MVYSLGAIILPILVFMCDAFADRIKSSLPQTKEQGEEWHFMKDDSICAYTARYAVGQGVKLRSVEVFEHAGNSAIYEA
jgi:hypothetical protein